jgi:hypothetical protein
VSDHAESGSIDAEEVGWRRPAVSDHADTIHGALAYLAGYGPNAQRKAGPADVALDALVARLRGVELRNRLLENERNGLVTRCGDLEDALREIEAKPYRAEEVIARLRAAVPPADERQSNHADARWDVFTVTELQHLLAGMVASRNLITGDLGPRLRTQLAAALDERLVPPAGERQET